MILSGKTMVRIEIDTRSSVAADMTSRPEQKEQWINPDETMVEVRREPELLI